MRYTGKRPHDTADRLIIYVIAIILTVLFVTIRANAEITGTSEAEQIRQVLSGSDIQDPEPVEDTEQQDYENQNTEAAALLEHAIKIENCIVTWYTNDTCGKRPGDPAYGITASGESTATHCTIATDPNVIPMYSDVCVQYADGTTEWFKATDTGVFGAHVDIYTDDYGQAIQNGKQLLTVYYIPPMEVDTK